MPGSQSWKPAETSSHLNATFNVVAGGSARRAPALPLFGREEHRCRQARGQHDPRGREDHRAPASDWPAEDMEPEYREWPIEFGDSGYVVLYRCHKQAAVILAVRHQRETGY